MNWESILTTLGGTAAVVAGVAWLARAIITRIIDRDLEAFRHKLEVESQKRIIEYSALHARRAQLTSDLYAKVYTMQQAIAGLLLQFDLRSVREEVGKKSPFGKREPWELRPGFELLDKHEEEAIQKVSKDVSDVAQFFGANRIFFAPKTCEGLERICALAHILTLNYENLALRDEDGKLRVNPKIKDLWDRAVQAIPDVLKSLEDDFRSALGDERK